MNPNFDKDEYKFLKKLAKKDSVHVRTRSPNGASSDLGVSVAFKPMHYGAEARMIAVAVSYCAPEDEFKKKTGKYNALNKFYMGEFVQLPLAAFLSYEGEDEVGEYLLDMFGIISKQKWDCGVIGSRKGFKIPRLVRAGSSPASPTKNHD